MTIVPRPGTHRALAHQHDLLRPLFGVRDPFFIYGHTHTPSLARHESLAHKSAPIDPPASNHVTATPVPSIRRSFFLKGEPHVNLRTRFFLDNPQNVCVVFNVHVMLLDGSVGTNVVLFGSVRYCIKVWKQYTFLLLLLLALSSAFSPHLGRRSGLLKKESNLLFFLTSNCGTSSIFFLFFFLRRSLDLNQTVSRDMDRQSYLTKNARNILLRSIINYFFVRS